MVVYSPIAELNNFIVLDRYEKKWQLSEDYQTEKELELELINDLRAQGYEYLPNLNTPEKMLANVRVQLEELNKVKFTNSEWQRFVTDWLDKPSDGIVDKTRRIHDDHILDFTFDDGTLKNISIVDKKNIAKNKLQVIKQFEQTGTHLNRYDVTILVNGLPLVHIELKRRGVAIKEAFNQIHRYSKESFNSESSLYKYLQIFVISNGTDTRYFANTTARNKNSYDFTMNWAKADNSLIKDLRDFTATFFQKNTILRILLHYSVFDSSDILLIMRPYQIAATERILWKIKSSFNEKLYSKPEGGGFIWHTTGSGKTLTSFKAARLATELDFIYKVFFVVDRKDLDYQTMKEYQRFCPDSVNGSTNTAALRQNLAKDDNKIIVTTIQKLNNLMKSEGNLPIYKEQVVFIFDECHRSQFGEAQRNIQRKFKKYYQFGFTGTPIFPENATGAETTASVFGQQLHSYVITDAIRDEKVLKFKVDYNDVRPKFSHLETEQDEEKLSSPELNRALLHPERIKEITKYIYENFNDKTHRRRGGNRGFNAMLAVSSIEAAKCYYLAFKEHGKDRDKPLKVATIFSYAANEEQNAKGEIADEGFNVQGMDTTGKEFLQLAIEDYNDYFKSSFSVDSSGFQGYYRDLAKRVKDKEVDLLIVVGMFLTGFDAPQLNTLFVDKNLRYHGLMQAYSRTNRIYDATKTFGNIVTFRNLEEATIEAISLFGDENTRNVVLEKSYKEYMSGFTDGATGETKRGFVELVAELEREFPEPAEIEREADKKAFAKLFGEYLRVENILQNYDEFVGLKAMQELDLADEAAVEAFKDRYYLDDAQMRDFAGVKVPSERQLQDYRSVYNDIREWLRRQRAVPAAVERGLNWDDVIFEVDLLKSQEINLDYILELLFEKKRKLGTEALVEEVRRAIRASIGNRAKEDLVVAFINEHGAEEYRDKSEMIEEFFKFARKEQAREAAELIESQELHIERAKRYIKASLKREYACANGTELDEILPKISPLRPEFLTKKSTVLEKIGAFVEKFKGIGGII